ncbi:Acetyltransferase (GNAT) family protein [Rhodobacteraceae bacterium THAF1]|uniref:GNAT family N-acetyltransferase n=1 Tax=Palleronia sp. THAF1 TaxID=2587842 RepID=UPI000F3CFB83|nr:GNAT family N-acetyltransferase [Palleronia sp. THAF1]QFU07470.1 Acetyltransferase (GNAT) family protein [Palleronia sp. THAF1]VDC20396.1 Acetyltransferase (GNAT) family protein [Rhodobacteraceae bacterium THAF1]
MSLSWKDGDIPIVGEYLELREAAGLPRATPAAAAKGLSGGLHCVTARDGARLVGILRIVGDGGLTVSLTDLAVHPDWRGQGIGRGLMQRAMAWCDDALPRGCAIGVVARPGSFALYTEAGFETRTAMERMHT